MVGLQFTNGRNYLASDGFDGRNGVIHRHVEDNMLHPHRCHLLAAFDHLRRRAAHANRCRVQRGAFDGIVVATKGVTVGFEDSE